MLKVLALLCIVQAAAVFVFLRGFLPVKIGSSNFADWNEKCRKFVDTFVDHREEYKQGSCAADLFSVCVNREPVIDRSVFIVIDALRADFIPQNLQSMQFLHSRIADGFAMSLIAKTQAPTVTMPRIKALTAGIVPGFVDVILNLASPALPDDNWLFQARKKGAKLAFFGDDTWLKLFPNVFSRSRGTQSFFVSDYTEVDNNVTDELPWAFRNTKDWDIMILHYLGLDHIGHTYGPKHPLIKTKLAEMDAIVERIFTELKKGDESLLITVVGDHGMTEAGSHGGASQPETTVPLVFISNTFKSAANGYIATAESVHQIDVVATLSALLALPSPKNNLGTPIIDVLTEINWSAKAENRVNNSYSGRDISLAVAAWDNCDQILQLYRKNLGNNMDYQIRSRALNADFKSTVLEPFCSGHVTDESTEVMAELYANFARDVRQEMLGSFAVYDLAYMVIGVAVSSLATVMAAYQAWRFNRNHSSTSKMSSTELFLAFGTVLHPASYASSSLVEEEHQTWYFLWPSLLFLMIVDCYGWNKRDRNRSWWNLSVFILLLVLCAHRVLRVWNQTGVKWAHLPDLTDLINWHENSAVKTVLFVSSLCVLLFLNVRSLAVHSTFRLVYGRLLLLYSAAFGTSIYYHIVSGHVHFAGSVALDHDRSPWPGRLALSVALILLVYAAKTRNINILTFGATFLAITLCKVENIPVLASLAVICTVVRYHVTLGVIGAYWLSTVGWFYMGNSNSLGTVDVASGYVGLTDYQPIVVAPLMLFYHYAAPILVWLYSYSADWKSRNVLWKLMLVRSLPITFFQILVIIQRYHLFVWSVFAPKLLYESLHTVLFDVFLFCFCCVCGKEQNKF